MILHSRRQRPATAQRRDFGGNGRAADGQGERDECLRQRLKNEEEKAQDSNDPEGEQKAAKAVEAIIRRERRQVSYQREQRPPTSRVGQCRLWRGYVRIYIVVTRFGLTGEDLLNFPGI